MKQSVRFGRYTLHFPRLSLLVFGDLFHVFVVNVVLAHKTVDPSVQQVDSWERTNAEIGFSKGKSALFVCQACVRPKSLSIQATLSWRL